MSMIVVRNKNTGNLIEAQSDPNSGPTLHKNAIASGHDPNAIEVVTMSDAQWATYKVAQQVLSMSYLQARAAVYPTLGEIIEDLQAQNVFSTTMKARIAAIQVQFPVAAFVPPIT